MDNTPNGWIDTPTGRIPDPRKQKPHVSALLSSETGVGARARRANSAREVNRAPAPRPEEGNFAQGNPTRSNSALSNSVQGNSAKHEATRSYLIVLLAVVLVAVFAVAWQPVSQWVNETFNQSSESSASTSQQEAAEESTPSTEYDTTLNYDDNIVVGKDWQGTKGASTVLKSYKPSISECKKILDDEDEKVIFCYMTWTNPYDTTVSLEDEEYPDTLQFTDSHSAGYVLSGYPKIGTEAYDELMDAPSVRPGKTGQIAICFNPEGNSTVWVSYDREKNVDGVDYRLSTTVASIDTKTLKVTNAVWPDNKS